MTLLLHLANPHTAHVLRAKVVPLMGHFAMLLISLNLYWPAAQATEVFNGVPIDFGSTFLHEKEPCNCMQFSRQRKRKSLPVPWSELPPRSTKHMSNQRKPKPLGEKTPAHRTSRCETQAVTPASIPIWAWLSNKYTNGKCCPSTLCLMSIIFCPNVWAMRLKFTETDMRSQNQQRVGCSAVTPNPWPLANSHASMSMPCGSAHHHPCLKVSVPTHLSCRSSICSRKRPWAKRKRASTMDASM